MSRQSCPNASRYPRLHLVLRFKDKTHQPPSYLTLDLNSPSLLPGLSRHSVFPVEAVNFKSFCAGIFFEGRSGSLGCHGGFRHRAEIKRPLRALLGVDRDAGCLKVRPCYVRSSFQTSFCCRAQVCEVIFYSAQSLNTYLFLPSLIK